MHLARLRSFAVAHILRSHSFLGFVCVLCTAQVLAVFQRNTVNRHHDYIGAAVEFMTSGLRWDHCCVDLARIGRIRSISSILKGERGPTTMSESQPTNAERDRVVKSRLVECRTR